MVKSLVKKTDVKFASISIKPATKEKLDQALRKAQFRQGKTIKLSAFLEDLLDNYKGAGK